MQRLYVKKKILKKEYFSFSKEFTFFIEFTFDSFSKLIYFIMLKL